MVGPPTSETGTGKRHVDNGRLPDPKARPARADDNSTLLHLSTTKNDRDTRVIPESVTTAGNMHEIEFQMSLLSISTIQCTYLAGTQSSMQHGRLLHKLDGEILHPSIR